VPDAESEEILYLCTTCWNARQSVTQPGEYISQKGQPDETLKIELDAALEG
jgi:hypothetical protein